MTYPVNMVGRLSEVQAIAKAVSGVVSGTGGIVLVGGEAGIGKTTLVNHVLESYAPTPVLSIACRCPGPGETIPYGPWREALFSLQMRGEFADLALLPAPFGSAPTVAEPFEVALSFIRWCHNAAAPLIITIDDLQWSDRASLDLLRHLSGRINGVALLVIGMYRSEDLHRSPEIRRYLSDMLRTGSQRILLQELNQAEVEELARTTLPHLDNPSHVADEVYRLTQGFPLFAAEILEQFKDAQHGTAHVSETIQQAIDSKLHLLDPAHVPILEEAAQIGEWFSYRLLRDISTRSQDAITAALDGAKRLGIVRNGDDPPATFQFRHAIVRSYLRDRMIGVRLERCHQTIAEVLERTSPNALDAIAFHYRRAHDPRFVQFLVAAGDHALRVGAIPDAQDRYQSVLDSLPEGDSLQAEILLKLGFCLRRRNDAGAVQIYEAALAAARNHGDLPVEVWARHFLFERAYIHGNHVKLGEIAELATTQQRLLTHTRYLELEQLFFQDHCEYPRIAVVYWSFLYTHGRLDEAAHMLSDLENRAGPHDPQLLGMKTRLCAFLGQLDETAVTARELSQAAYHQHNDRTATVLFTNYVYHTYLAKTDQPETVDTAIQELLRMEDDINRRNGFGFMPKGYSAAGFYDYASGRWTEGRKHLIDYVLSESEPDQLITWFAAVMLVETGDTRALDAVLAKLVPRCPTDPPVPSNTIFTWVHAIRAQACLLKHEADLAKEWLKAADAHPLSQVSKLHRPLIDIAWSDYYRQIGDAGKAIAACERALDWAMPVPIPWFIIKARRRLGELVGELGKWTEAFAWLEDAAALAQTCRLPYEAALCRLSIGRVWRAYESTANRTDVPELTARRGTWVEYLQGALDVFTQLGARERMEAASLLEAVRINKARPVNTTVVAQGVLTEREWEVAKLVAGGLTDKEVAAMLCVSPRTVDHHLRSIFRKLDIRRRTALAAYLSGSPRDVLN